MSRTRSPESQILFELEQDLSAELEALRPEAMQHAESVLGRELSLHSFHAIIGRWNNELADCIRNQFSDPEDFFARWLAGLQREVRNEIATQEEKYGSFLSSNKAILRLLRLMQDRTVRHYTYVFLVRNFYRNLIARTRAKPEEQLWSLWFGENKIVWGLIIAPAYRNQEWTNDKSEIRRASYDYWTIGHVLATGLVDPESDELVTFTDITEFIRFYRSVLKRVSNSIYEREIADRYVKYLRDSDAVDSEPFLIPELRYAGREKKHKYRLDYAILNSHVMSFTGFELSPSSTHYQISGIKKKGLTQKAINAEFAVQWEGEMDKRNRYFSRFGITTITFTDAALADADACFAEMARHLGQRSSTPMKMEEQIQAIESMTIPT